jgi:hypothetical protein
MPINLSVSLAPPGNLRGAFSLSAATMLCALLALRGVAA